MDTWAQPEVVFSESIVAAAYIQGATLALIILAFLFCTVSAAVVCFRTKHNGGRWMLAAVVLLVAEIVYFVPMGGLYTPFFHMGIAGRKLVGLTPYVPLLLFSFGVFRLSWQLKSQPQRNYP